MPAPLRALIVEDSADDAELLARELRRSGYDVRYERAYDADTLDRALANGPWDIVFSDHSMPDFGSGRALQMVRGRDPDVPFLIVSGTMGEDVAVDAMRAGANDYFIKGRLARLPAVVDRELRQAASRAARRSLDRTFQALREVSSAIGRLPDPKDVAGLTVKHARALLEADAAAMHVWDPEAAVLRPVARAAGSAETPAFVIRPGEGAAGLAFEQREVVAVEDLRMLARRPLPHDLSIVSALATPLMVGARPVGVLVALSKRTRRFTGEERELIQLLASDVAPTFEAGRLFAESERQRAEAEALADASRSVAAGGDERDSLRSLLAAMLRVVPSTAAGIFVAEESGARVTLRAAAGGFGGLAGRSLDCATTLLGRTLRTRSVQIRGDDEAAEETQVVLGAPIALAVPILRGEGAVAVLGIAPLRDRRVGPRDAQLVQRFASIAAIALENARLRGEADDRAAELERLAHIDALTGLPNRNLFRELLAAEIDRVRQGSAGLALLHIDVDHFKDTNDVFGLEVGDELLRAVGTRLRDVFGDGIVARLPGDEFAALVRTSDPAEILRLARATKTAFDEPIATREEQVSLRVSVGVATSPRDAADADTLLRSAEVAMAMAKRADGVATYAPEHDHYAPERLALMSQLRRAIERDELVLHFQPVVELATRRVTGLEALVRWHHRDRGLVPPLEFIPLAERAGLTKPLTVWVLREALRHARRWRDEGLDLTVAVNLSMRTLHDEELPGIVRDLVHATGVPPEAVTFEITESDVMADAAGAMRVLGALREMGVRFAIDDFGTGYSSLAYLHRLAVHSVKIDRSFVRRLTADESSAAIVRATVELARALGLRVIAEGVEDRDAWSRLGELACDEAQGYHIARPMSAGDVAGWIAAWRRAAE